MQKWRWIITATNRTHLLNVVSQAVANAPIGYTLTVAEPGKSRDQEEKYHAMIGDIAKCCTFMGREWDRESWKRLMIDAFVQVKRAEAIAEGKPDPFEAQGMSVPSLDGMRIVQLGVQSRRFTKAQASDFIEHLYHYGSENNVRWSEASNRVINEWRSQHD